MAIRHGLVLVAVPTDNNLANDVSITTLLWQNSLKKAASMKDEKNTRKKIFMNDET